MSQDLVAIGLDVSSFNAEKRVQVEQFISLFDQLSKYDGKVFSPILGGGLIEFNNSIKETSVLLADLNTKLTASKSASKASSDGTKALTAEQAALKVQLQETNKATLAQAAAQNTSVQAKEAQKKATADLLALNKLQYKAETEMANQQLADSKLILSMQKQEAAAKAKNAADNIKAAKETEVASRQAEAQNKRNVKAMQEESAAAKILTNDLLLLKKANADQGVRFSNLYINKGKNDPETITALKEYEASSKVINNIEGKLSDAGGKAKLFGGALSTAFGHLRNIAYILPGLGIAGIFNIAFEAIGNVVTELGSLGGEEKKQIGLVKEMNDAWLELNETYEKAFQSQRDLFSLSSQSIHEQIRVAEVTQSRGYSKDTTLKDDVDNAKRLAEVSEVQLKHYNSNIESLRQSAVEIQGQIETKAQEINRLKELSLSNTTLFGLGTSEKEKNDAKIGLLQSELSSLNFEYTTKKKVIDDYYQTRQDLARKTAEYEKYLEDEARRKLYETTKNNISVKTDEQDKILSKEISSFNEKLSALKQIKALQEQSNAATLLNVTSNKSSTKADIDIAKNKQYTDNLKAAADFQQDSEKLFEEYRQRLLTAREKIDKDNVEKSAIANEKVFKNETINLDERLKAFEKYIIEKQKLQDIEDAREIDRLFLKAKGPVPQKEIDAIHSNRDQQKASIQADAEKQIYDIVFQSLGRRLKAIVDYNKAEDDTNLNHYTDELEALNKSYKDKNISFQNFKIERARLAEKYDRKVLDDTIDDDTKDINRLRENKDTLQFRKKASDKEKDSADLNLTFAKNYDPESKSEAQRRYDAAVGESKAIADAINKNEEDLSAKEHKRNEDRNRRAKLSAADQLALDEKLYKKRKEIIDALKQIEEALYQFIKTTVDAQYERRIEKVQELNRVQQEQLASEIAAVQKSSLTSKDKEALDVQLNAQKLERDKAAAAEEKRLKHDQAVFDKELTIAHILLSTAAAVAAQLAIPGAGPALAIAAGVAGAAELATAIAVQVPSYKYGTEDHPGGMARFGEDGLELVKEPYKSPYFVNTETIATLPAHTKVIPIKNAEFPEKTETNTWDQTKWLAKQFKKNSQQPRAINNIYIDLGFESFKRKVLG